MIQQINLYQPILREPRKVFSAHTMASIVGIVIIALLLLYGWGLWQTHQMQSQVAILKAQKQHDSVVLAKLDARLSGQTASAALTQALAEARQKRDAKQALLNILSASPHAGTVGFVPALEGLAHTQISGLWFTHILLSSGGNDVRLAGQTTRSAQVPQLVHELAHTTAFAGVNFKRLQISRNKDDTKGQGELGFVLSTTPLKKEH